MIVKPFKWRGWVLFFLLPYCCLAEAPSEDFWQFYSEFADDQGDLIDPIELEQLGANGVKNLAEMPTEDSPDSTSEEEPK